MATLLELVNLARREAGVASSDLSTVQGTLSKESADFKSWVIREWKAIQSRHRDWQFLRKSAVFTTTADQRAYTIAEVGAASTPAFAEADFGSWIPTSFRFFKNPDYSDEAFATYYKWDAFRNIYMLGNSRGQSGTPVVFTINPERGLALGDTPDDVYTTVFEYYRSPVTLSADADTPAMPVEYHDLIVFKALRAYAIDKGAPELLTRADEEIKWLFPALRANQLPPITAGAPLA